MKKKTSKELRESPELREKLKTSNKPKARTNAHSERGHAPLSPSGGKRWGTCPGSLWLSRGVLTTTSEAAKEGTIAHEWVERLFEAAKEGNYEAELAKCELYDEEMAHYCDGYIDFLDTIKAGFHNKRFDEYEEYLEQRVELTRDIWGTLDWSCIRRPKKKKWQAVIADFKYGRGTYVPVEDNWQMIIYALCLQKHIGVKFEKVWMWVYQPRYAKDKAYEMAVLEEKELDHWANIVAEAEKIAIDTLYGRIPPVYVVGDHCQFCPAQTKCEAFKKDMVADGLQLLDTDPTILPEVERLPTKTLVAIHEKKKQIEHFLENADHELLMRGRRGESLKSFGLKIVESRSRRRWREDMDVEDIANGIRELKLNPYKKKLINIGEVERKVGKGELDHLTEKPPGKVQLTSIDDQRPVARPGIDLLPDLDVES